ncbi:DUF484 family protein [Hydrogenophaga pseudoflava]|uniref:DUF484 family protein n=1 Tax=Hydrogenophaga pseudoflava TaxID=47421 RepID=UPI0027E5BC34|nr:DUF484 family protein [Hydrogenophaga pseudoflava]MDQ7745029.1 DUF484 family protein [Hydrogenophaga pseudoflava]
MTDPTIPPITEDDIANYLANTPDFFERHAGVLAAVQLSSPHGQRAVSLQERQAEMLREKIKGLELRSADMIRHGQENSAIADRLHRWTRELLTTRETQDLPLVAAREMAAQFNVPQVAIKLWGVADDFSGQSYAQGASDDVQAFASSLPRPYCGANPGLEAAGWLVDPGAVASLALIPLRAGAGQDAFGLLVLGSPDPQRFAADMGTEFLERMGDLTAAALSRLRP